ncbi:MAG: hypothetical protein AAF804_04235, partial [Bacteroidota bacterium]
MKHLWLPCLALLLGFFTESCRRPVNPIAMGPLEFSADTVKFDSIFVNFLTPSERLIVRNPESQAVLVERVWLAEGSESEFSLLVDGIVADTVEDLVIAGGDSMLVIVNLRSELRDDFAEEILNFQIGEDTYQILLRAKV